VDGVRRRAAKKVVAARARRIGGQQTIEGFDGRRQRALLAFLATCCLAPRTSNHTTDRAAAAKITSIEPTASSRPPPGESAHQPIT